MTVDQVAALFDERFGGVDQRSRRYFPYRPSPVPGPVGTVDVIYAEVIAAQHAGYGIVATVADRRRVVTLVRTRQLPPGTIRFYRQVRPAGV